MLRPRSGDEVGGDDGFAESGGGGEDAGLVFFEVGDGRLLLGAELAAEGELEGLAFLALVVDGVGNI